MATKARGKLVRDGLDGFFRTSPVTVAEQGPNTVFSGDWPVID